MVVSILRWLNWKNSTKSNFLSALSRESSKEVSTNFLNYSMKKLLNVGDRVKLTCDGLLDKAGKLGTVTRKYVPAHCTGAWSITVKWDGNSHETGYSYPGAPLVHA